jgi:hypothetical protein
MKVRVFMRYFGVGSGLLSGAYGVSQLMILRAQGDQTLRHPTRSWTDVVRSGKKEKTTGRSVAMFPELRE